MTLPGVAEVVEAGRSEGVFPSAQVCVGLRGRVVHRSAHGEASLSTRFDCASVTKMAATTMAAGLLASGGALGFDDPVCRFLPDFGRPEIRLRHLLVHGSGLAPWKPFFGALYDDPVAAAIYPTFDGDRRAAFTAARAFMRQAVQTDPSARPPGQRAYSDVGFMNLGFALEAAAGEGLDTFCARELYGPLGLTRTGFFDLREPVTETDIAPTGVVRPRMPTPDQVGSFTVYAQPQQVVLGEVDDDNAFALAGVAGHAGLFSTADELVALGTWLCEQVHAGGVWAEMVRADATTTGAERALGFDRPTPPGSSVGDRFGQAGPLGGIGHLGFTGGSLWIDLDRHLVVALLTNRTHPHRVDYDHIRRFRPRFHETVIDAVA